MFVFQTYDARIGAACRELGTNKFELREVIKDLNIGINSQIVQNLAIWEPRSFKVSIFLGTLRKNM